MIVPHPTAPSTGRIDIHGHLIPGIDDGCAEFEESLACVRRLKQAGFVGSVCTPHIWPNRIVYTRIEDVRIFTQHLQEQLDQAGEEYLLWPGGELGLYDKVLDWLKETGPPTLARSRCVLVDFWADRWPKWVNRAFDWLLSQGYQPILAHPERLGCKDRVMQKRLYELCEMGVWLQGNFRCMTGRDGAGADRWVHKLLSEGRYKLMATDVHGPDSLEARLDGMQLVEAEFGPDVLDQMTVRGPRDLILSYG